MPLNDRAYMRGEHPSSCSCEDCVSERIGRLKRLRKAVHPSYVSTCPICRQKSLWHNAHSDVYECLNLKCQAVGSTPEEISRRSLHSDQQPKQVLHSDQQPKQVRKPIRRAYKIPGWLQILLFIFASSFLGFGISALLNSAIPLLILLGLSVIYAVRKQLFPAVLSILILIAVTSTVSMIWPQGVIRVVPKELEVLHVLPTRIDAANIEKAIFELVNQERVNEGLSPLLWDESLAQYSRKHSSDMAIKGSLYHDKPELAKLQAGENALLISKYSGGFIFIPFPIGLAFYRTDGELYNESVKSWMGSPGHRLNILTSSYKYTGTGVAIAEDGVTCYITQNFR